MFMVLVGQSQAAPKAELWARWQKHDPASAQRIDHGAWDRLLKQYVVGHPSGINRVRYQEIRAEDQKLLKNYLQTLQGLAISAYNRKEQQAYWINLYNALTVDLILSRFPVASIRDINISPGLLARGPWGAKLVTVEGEKLSLDDIEHRILRPIWQDESNSLRASTAPAWAARIYSRRRTPAKTPKRCSTRAPGNSSTIRAESRLPAANSKCRASTSGSRKISAAMPRA